MEGVRRSVLEIDYLEVDLLLQMHLLLVLHPLLIPHYLLVLS
jgi:hypothetical protein